MSHDVNQSSLFHCIIVMLCKNLLMISGTKLFTVFWCYFPPNFIVHNLKQCKQKSWFCPFSNTLCVCATSFSPQSFTLQGEIFWTQFPHFESTWSSKKEKEKDSCVWMSVCGVNQRWKGKTKNSKFKLRVNKILLKQLLWLLLHRELVWKKKTFLYAVAE